MLKDTRLYISYVMPVIKKLLAFFHIVILIYAVITYGSMGVLLVVITVLYSTLHNSLEERYRFPWLDQVDGTNKYSAFIKHHSFLSVFADFVLYFLILFMDFSLLMEQPFFSGLLAQLDREVLIRLDRIPMGSINEIIGSKENGASFASNLNSFQSAIRVLSVFSSCTFVFSWSASQRAEHINPFPTHMVYNVRMLVRNQLIMILFCCLFSFLGYPVIALIFFVLTLIGVVSLQICCYILVDESMVIQGMDQIFLEYINDAFSITRRIRFLLIQISKEIITCVIKRIVNYGISICSWLTKESSYPLKYENDGYELKRILEKVSKAAEQNRVTNLAKIALANAKIITAIVQNYPSDSRITGRVNAKTLRQQHMHLLLCQKQCLEERKRQYQNYQKLCELLNIDIRTKNFNDIQHSLDAAVYLVAFYSVQNPKVLERYLSFFDVGIKEALERSPKSDHENSKPVVTAEEVKIKASLPHILNMLNEFKHLLKNAEGDDYIYLLVGGYVSGVFCGYTPGCSFNSYWFENDISVINDDIIQYITKQAMACCLVRREVKKKYHISDELVAKLQNDNDEVIADILRLIDKVDDVLCKSDINPIESNGNIKEKMPQREISF